MTAYFFVGCSLAVALHVARAAYLFFLKWQQAEAMLFQTQMSLFEIRTHMETWRAQYHEAARVIRQNKRDGVN